MTKIKAIRKVFKKFQSIGTRFEEGDLIIINGNEIYHIYNNPNRTDGSKLSAYHYEDVDNFQIGKIIDNSRDDE